MEKELLEKIKSMVFSGDPELLELGRNLFYNSNPTIEDYLHCGGTRSTFQRSMKLAKEEGYIVKKEKTKKYGKKKQKDRW